MKFKELEEKILDFADDNSLLEPDNLLQRVNTLKRDMEHLHFATLSKSKGFKEYITEGNHLAKTDDDIKTYIGKTMLDLVIFAEMNGLSLEDCLTESFKKCK